MEQSPPKTMQTALSPLTEALAMEALLEHSDIDVKVGVASCISEITRITAPDAPYDDDKMKVDIFDILSLSHPHPHPHPRPYTLVHTLTLSPSVLALVGDT